MRKILYLSAVWGGAFAAWIGFWIGTFELVHLAKGDNQATPFYGFTSGPGPMIETAVFASTILAAFWHSLNCHDPSCWRIGRHRVNGTPYCNLHHDAVRHAYTTEELLLTIVRQNEDVLRHFGITEGAGGEALAPQDSDHHAVSSPGR